MSNQVAGASVAAYASATVFAAVICATLIVLLHPLLQRYALARPNARSSHKVPTPQGGGIAVIGATIIVTCASLYFSVPAAPMEAPLLPVLAAVILIACVGAVDDIRPIHVGPRLLLQALAVGLVVFTLPHELRVTPFLPWWIERVSAVVAGLWFINLVNFMDGLDWMTVAEVVPITAALAVLGRLDALPVYGTIVALSLCGAMIAFAYFNRPIAKLFLGDVGSLPIGLLLAWLLFLLAARGHLAGAVVLPLYYLADATITLLRRLGRGEPVWQAHRSHFYQRATDRGFSVIEVTGLVFAANLGLCALAVLTVMVPGRSSDIAALAGGAVIVAGVLTTFARGKTSAAAG